MREWILNIVNSLSGGELEQHIKKIETKLDALRKANAVDKSVQVGQVADMNDLEHAIRIEQ